MGQSDAGLLLFFVKTHIWIGIDAMANGKYHEWLESEGLLRLEGWARDGLTDEQIAKNMGISAKTLYVWKLKYGEICNALKRGKEVVDRQVENALLKRALGYIFEEVKETHKGGELVEKIVTKKEVLGDVTAQIFWLKNRMPDKYRSRRDVLEIDTDGGVTIINDTVGKKTGKDK